MKKIFLWAAVLVLVFLVARPVWFSFYKSQGFKVSKMQASIPNKKEWEVEFPSGEELKEIFKQKFHFLSSGYQTYAFLSEDKKTIIKFFRMKRLTHSWTDQLFHPKKITKHQNDLAFIFNAYKLAYDEMREDAGLLYIHLNKTNYLKTKLFVTDPKGKEILLDLDNTHFIVQERAEPLFTYLHKFIELKDKQGLEKAINAYLSLVKKRLEKGICDDDMAIAGNYGFIGDRPIQFDIGRIHKGKIEGEYEEIVRRLSWWVHLNPIP